MAATGSAAGSGDGTVGFGVMLAALTVVGGIGLLFGFSFFMEEGTTGSTCFVCDILSLGCTVTILEPPLGWTGMSKTIGGAESSFAAGFYSFGNFGSGTCFSFTGCLVDSCGQLKSVLFYDTTSKSYG